MELSRRSFFRGLGAILAAPPIAKVASLLPPLEAARIRSVNYLTLQEITREAVRRFTESNEFLRQWDEEFAKDKAVIGTQLRIRLPSEYRVASINRIS